MPRLSGLLSLFCCATLLLMLASPSSARAAGLRLSGEETKIPLAMVVTIFEDKTSSLSIDEAVRTGRFVTSPERLVMRPEHPTLWLKLELTNSGAASLTRWLEIQPARLREATLYQWRNGAWVTYEAGTNVPFSHRPLANPVPLFPIVLAPHEESTYYLRISNPLPVAVVPTLWQPDAYRTVESRTHLIDGLLLGALALMILFGLLLSPMFGDRAFLFNALATATYFFGEASAKGYGFMYFWPEATTWTLRSLPLYALLGVGLNLLFLRHLLNTRLHYPRIDKVLLALLVCEWALAPGILFGDYAFWASLSFPLHFPITIAMVTVGIHAMTQGVRAARYYIAGYTVLALGSLITGLTPRGFDMPPLLSDYALPTGMLLNNLLLMLSAVERILDVRREKEAAQNALLAAHAAHEAHLEKAVEERTEELHQALTEAETANESQTRLLAYVGHDLRAPLATILNYLGLLGKPANAEAARYQATIKRSALHQLELIDDLVEYARGRLDQLELVPAAVFLHDWLDNIAKQSELLAGQQNNRLVLDTSNLPAVVVMDDKRLRQVLINLISNAAKFTKNGAIRLRLHATTLGAEQVALHFAVEDTGAGIPAYDLERIFNPFERLKATSEGTGLGLTIARQLVQAMGGNLEASSTPDVGSCFSFSINVPLAQESDVPLPDQNFNLPSLFGRGKSVLIADDNQASREYLQEVLLTADFDVECAANGEEALQRALAQDFAAIVIDQYMPRMNGWEFLRRYREAKPDANVPVILCSAMWPQRPADFPPGVDFAATLLKPIQPEKILRVVEEQITEPRPLSRL